jgi:hypothetical protein
MPTSNPVTTADKSLMFAAFGKMRDMPHSQRAADATQQNSKSAARKPKNSTPAIAAGNNDNSISSISSKVETRPFGMPVRNFLSDIKCISFSGYNFVTFYIILYFAENYK